MCINNVSDKEVSAANVSQRFSKCLQHIKIDGRVQWQISETNCE